MILFEYLVNKVDWILYELLSNKIIHLFDIYFFRHVKFLLTLNLNIIESRVKAGLKQINPGSCEKLNAELVLKVKEETNLVMPAVLGSPRFSFVPPSPALPYISALIREQIQKRSHYIRKQVSLFCPDAMMYKHIFDFVPIKIQIKGENNHAYESMDSKK